MKVCRTCRVERADTDFYVSRSDCKTCVCAAVRLRRRLNPAVQEYDRQRAKTAKRKAKARAITARWRTSEKMRAHNAVARAVKAGKLVKEPCMFCQTTKHVHAHHRDYARPLDVSWLCAKCHHRMHASFPEHAKAG